MNSMQIIVDSREASNKGAARRLRKSGRIPAVLYGEGEPKSLSVDAGDWMMRFRNVSGNTIVNLKHGESEHQVLVKDVQDDILSGRVNHIDFFAIHAGVKLHTRVPVQLEGSPHGVREGGILEHKIEELDVVCLPKDLPSFFTVDISHLGVGESLHVREIDIPEGVEVRTEANLTVVVVSHAKAEITEAAEGDEEGLDGEAGGAAAAESSGGEE